MLIIGTVRFWIFIEHIWEPKMGHSFFFIVVFSTVKLVAKLLVILLPIIKTIFELRWLDFVSRNIYFQKV